MVKKQLVGYFILNLHFNSHSIQIKIKFLKINLIVIESSLNFAEVYLVSSNNN